MKLSRKWILMAGLMACVITCRGAVFTYAQDSLIEDDHPEPVPEEASEKADEAVSEAEDTTENAMGKETPHNPLEAAYEQLVAPREPAGEVWELSYEDLSTGLKFGYNTTQPVQSASVIKVFIMGTVYERICYPKTPEDAVSYTEGWEGELRSLLEQMITVSDNEAANRLIDILGEGDSAAGMEAVNSFCQQHGYSKTHLGRKFLVSNPTDDNYTCAADCRQFLSDIYHGKLVNEEASEKMLAFLKGQTIRHKIPSGLPAGYACANKTGDMPEGYGLGCIENDIAIVFPPDGRDYVLTVLSSNLAGRNTEAQQTISAISAKVAAGE